MHSITDPIFLEDARRYKNELRERLRGVGAHAFEFLSMLTSDRAAAGGERIPREVRWPPDDNVIGIGFGLKQVDGRYSEDLAIRVYVRSKMAAGALHSRLRVPRTVNGMPTDVIELGDIVAHARPVNCGASISHERYSGSGTLGCLVRKRDDDGRRFILSNNHILTNLNRCAVHDSILEPGVADHGRLPIARLSEWQPLDFCGGTNRLDAAIAALINVDDVNPQIPVIGGVPGPVWPASLGDGVRKYGRTSQLTEGKVVDLAADVRVHYGTSTADFEDVVAVEGEGVAFSQHGDSGALIVEKTSHRALGLLFSGGSRTSFACPIGDVLEHFGVEIV